MATPPVVTAVVPTHNRAARTLAFCQRFEALTYRPRRLVIVDSGSTDGTPDAVRKRFAWATVVRVGDDQYWAGATNAGVQRALADGADYVLTINDDAGFGPDLLDRLLAAARLDPRYIVGARLMRADLPDRVKAIGSTLVARGFEVFTLNHEDRPWAEVAPRLVDPQPVQTMPGDGVLLPRCVFERVGLYDADHMPHYHADTDLMLRAAAAGFVPMVALGAVVYDDPADHPLPPGLWSAMTSIRSPRYAKAVWHTVRRHARHAGPVGVVAGQALPFALPAAVRERLRARRRARRLG